MVRHGETRWNLEQRFQGHTDIELSEKGKRQAMLISHRLRDVPVSAVYSSDLSRAYVTAQIIADYHNLPVNQIPELKEMSYGEWEGKMFQEINKEYGEQFLRWMSNPTIFQIPNGEAIDELQLRVVKAITEIVEKHPGEQVVVVTHGIAIRTIISSVLGLPLSQISRFRQDNASLNIVEFYKGKGVVLALNDTYHLSSK